MIVAPIVLYTHAGRQSRRIHAAFATAGVHQTLAERVALKRNAHLTRMMLLFNYFQVNPVRKHSRLFTVRLPVGLMVADRRAYCYHQRVLVQGERKVTTLFQTGEK
jgi:hypothetical protein